MEVFRRCLWDCNILPPLPYVFFGYIITNSMNFPFNIMIRQSLFPDSEMLQSTVHCIPLLKTTGWTNKGVFRSWVAHLMKHAMILLEIVPPRSDSLTYSSKIFLQFKIFVSSQIDLPCVSWNSPFIRVIIVQDSPNMSFFGRFCFLTHRA